jgi:hypothetical protein
MISRWLASAWMSLIGKLPLKNVAQVRTKREHCHYPGVQIAQQLTLERQLAALKRWQVLGRANYRVVSMAYEISEAFFADPA